MNAWTQTPRVLITRPAAQQENFRQQCEKAGFATLSLACIEIQFLEMTLELTELQLSDKVLFTSTNAVQAAHRLLPLPWPDVSVCGIGPATERALARLGQDTSWSAVAPYNSEAFLDQLKVRGIPETLTIIKGEAGREWMIEALQRHGVRVIPTDLYRRTLPNIGEKDRRHIFDAEPIDIVTVTSDEILMNLLLLAGDAYRDQLLELPLICNSRRCAELAAALGFSIPARVAIQPGDAGQLAQLHDWLKQGTTKT